jgi:thiamine biosynthesis lipoprotein
VLGPDLATADALATAALAMGANGPSWAAARFACSVAAVDAGGRLWTSPGIEAARVA